MAVTQFLLCYQVQVHINLCASMEVIFRELFIASVSSPPHINSLSFCLLSVFISLTLSDAFKICQVMVDAMWLLISCSGNLRERSLVAMATAEACRWSSADYLDLEREWESGDGLANHNVITEKMLLLNNTDTWYGVYLCAISEQILGAYLDTEGGGLVGVEGERWLQAARPQSDFPLCLIP